MNPDDLTLISVDDHVVEPPDMWEQVEVPAKYRDRVPKVVRKPDGSDVWTFEGEEIPNVGLNAVAGWDPKDWGFEPVSFDEIRPGCYDIHERIRDMNYNGVLASMNFPSFVQFAGQLFMKIDDKDLALAMVRAYNDWHIDVWAGTYPGRIIPQAIPPIWDPQLMADEVRRVADKGCHAITFSENPAKLGLPSWHSGHWDPFLDACQETGTVVCLHIGSSSALVITAADAPIDTMITLQPMNSVQAATDVLWSPVLRKFPDLKFFLSEGGIGWVPYFLERVDYAYHKHRQWTHQDFGDKLPSQVFLEHFTLCFIDDQVGIELRDHLGIGSITWECDYPHSDSSWPNSPELVSKQLDGLERDEVDRITHRNAMELLKFDPFQHVAREEATVAALRALSPDVNPKTERPKGRKLDTGDGPVDFTKLAELAAKANAPAE